MELEVDLKLDKAEAGRFWVATLMFLGLKFEKEFIDFLMKGVENMKASTYHKAIFE